MPTMSEFSDIRVGLVGAGFVSDFHLKAWAKISGARVIAICDPNPAHLAQRADRFGIGGRFADLDDLFAGTDINVLDIASPREFHFEHAIRAVAAAEQNTLAIQCQKPLAPTLAEAEKLAECVPSHLPFMVHENWRFRPEYRKVKIWLDEERIGPVVSCRMDIRTSALYPNASGNRPAVGRQPFMAWTKRLAVAEVFVHHIDTLRWLMGPLTPTEVLTFRTQQILPGETAAVLNFRGVAGFPVTVDGHMAVPGAPNRASDRLEIIGTQGRILFEGTRLIVTGAAAQELSINADESTQASFDATIAHFSAGLRTGIPFETSLEDNLHTLRLVEGAYAMPPADLT